jgi:hypothetical protein
MRRLVATAGALVASAALVGATAAVTSADEDHHRATRTLHFVDTAIRQSQTGATTFAGAGVDKVKGKVIGYSAVTGTVDSKTQTARIQVAVALKGGIIVLGLTQGDNPHLHGRVLTGTGRFRGATGTFTGTQTSDIRTVVTVRLRLHHNGEGD